ncbi:MAG: alpha/beta hydrolase [Clostridia bacterium]|nr:alpha/beta hydrolase [Clostridia bacterium]
MSFLAKAFYVDDLIKHKGANGLSYPNVTEVNDIVYDESMPDECKLDILFDASKRPENGKFPVVVNIHGGGWISGDKRFRRGVCIQFADDGNFVVNVNYALTPKYDFPTEMRNIFSALQWVKDNADKYGYDLDKMVLTGDSAGAHLSACTIVCLNNADWQKKFDLAPIDINFKGTMLFCGPYDFTEFWMRFPVLDTMYKGIANIKRKKDIDKCPYKDYLNPIPAVDASFPKTLVVMGLKDFVTNPHNRKLMRKFDEVGVEYEKHMAKHFFNCFHDFHLKIWMPAAKKAMQVAKDYVKKVI